MTMPQPPEPIDVPSGWGLRIPGPGDVESLVRLHAAAREAAGGSARIDADAVRTNVVGTGSWTRRQLIALSPDGAVRAWASVHDRAAGRTMISVEVDPQLGDDAGDDLAARLHAWAQGEAVSIGTLRGLSETMLDADAYAGDAASARRLTAAGFHRARTWLQMTRPVDAAEAEEDAFPAPREGVTIRRVHTYDDGLPVAEDVQMVHLVLEESFADHWGSYRESFPEFMHRLREDPGHRWDHWWIALVEADGALHPGGALVSTVLPPDAGGIPGSYIDYIGVHRRSRGRGVAKGLLHSVIRDAAGRGRNRVVLEVDADSPTGADGLYASMGWVTTHRTESWHRDLSLA